MRFLFCIPVDSGIYHFLQSSFFHDPADVGNLISGSSAFCKTNFNIWMFMVHVLQKPGLENFEHYFTSVWDECNFVVVWAFFGTVFLWDWNENWRWLQRTAQKCGWEELPHVQGQRRQPRGATTRPRSGGCAAAGRPRGATPRSRSGGVAVRKYPSSKARSSSCTLLEQLWRDTPQVIRGLLISFSFLFGLISIALS